MESIEQQLYKQLSHVSTTPLPTLFEASYPLFFLFSLLPKTETADYFDK